VREGQWIDGCDGLRELHLSGQNGGYNGSNGLGELKL
jgi:hypothetical protein